jgi:hypothetical protein
VSERGGRGGSCESERRNRNRGANSRAEKETVTEREGEKYGEGSEQESGEAIFCFYCFNIPVPICTRSPFLGVFTNL